MKTHWLFGRGPDKIVEFNVEIDAEDTCAKCIHHEVCSYNMNKFCANYSFGTSEYSGCQGCLHKYTRWDKDAIPCFKCNHYQEE